MTIEILKKLIKAQQDEHADFIRKAKEAERYYETDNDVLHAEKQIIVFREIFTDFSLTKKLLMACLCRLFSTQVSKASMR